jgi:ArsR family transcriptional regulator
MKMTPEQLLAAMGHDVRLRCLVLLQTEGQLCVCELTHALGMAQPTVSRHLALLRDAGWVEDQRQGLWVHYSLNPKLPPWARRVLAATAEGIAGRAPCASDQARLGRMANRPGAKCA